jgi:hypothetical protein
MAASPGPGAVAGRETGVSTSGPPNCRASAAPRSGAGWSSATKATLGFDRLVNPDDTLGSAGPGARNL